MTAAEQLAACVGRPDWPAERAERWAGLAAEEAGHDATSGRGRREAGRLYLGAALDWFSARMGADARGILSTSAEAIRASAEAGRASSTRRHPGPGPRRPEPEPGQKPDEVWAAAVDYALAVFGHSLGVASFLGMPVADVERALLERCGELDRAERPPLENIDNDRD